MKRLCLFILGLAACSCHTPAKPNNHNLKAQSTLKTAIIGDWTPEGAYPGIDTFNVAKMPDIQLDANLSFYNNGCYKKHDVYYRENNQNKKAPGYIANYRVNSDTLFVFEPISKHWYALHATINSSNKLEIDTRKGYSHLDTHYLFSKSDK